MAKIRMRKVVIEPFSRIVHIAIGDNGRNTINAMMKALNIPKEVDPRKTSIASCYTVWHEEHGYILLAFPKTMSMGVVVHEVFHVVNEISYDGTGDPIGKGSDEAYAYTLEMAVDRVGKAVAELGGSIYAMGKG